MTPILATDLDGTLIPGESLLPNDPQHLALATLRQSASDEKLELVFVTGRHHDSVIEIMQAKNLPSPQWIICDVGTSIFHRDSPSQQQPYRPVQAYVNHLDQIVGSFSVNQLAAQIAVKDDLKLQEPQKQGRHKLSFYCDAILLDRHVEAMQRQIDRLAAPYRIVSSVDPFNGGGLIDLLPAGTDKSSALLWWANFRQCDPSAIVFAGDSGNDYAALTAGFRAILVGNASRELAKRVTEHHLHAGHPEQIFLAPGHATAGVLEGCRWFKLVDDEQSDGLSGVRT
jgi:maltooligosyltrehalose trehalohydrolase